MTVAACTSAQQDGAEPATSPPAPSTLASATSATPTPTPSTSATVAGGPAGFVSSGPRTKQQVALTFHASGDPDLATQLLALLDARHVPMTAFVVGSWLDANPALASRMLASGHELANHTYTHPAFSHLDAAAMANEVVQCRDALLRLGGAPGAYFRPSGTSNGTDTPADEVLEAARQAGYRVVLGYDVDPADYTDPGAATVSARVLAAIQPGSVVSLHFGHQGTLDALPAVLSGLAQRGLQPVTASALLAL